MKSEGIIYIQILENFQKSTFLNKSDNTGYFTIIFKCSVIYKASPQYLNFEPVY